MLSETQRSPITKSREFSYRVGVSEGNPELCYCVIFLILYIILFAIWISSFIMNAKMEKSC